MEGIEFEREAYQRPIAAPGPRRSWAIALVMKIGGKRVKSEGQAQRILVIGAVILFLLSVYNFFF